MVGREREMGKNSTDYSVESKRSEKDFMKDWESTSNPAERAGKQLVMFISREVGRATTACFKR